MWLVASLVAYSAARYLLCPSKGKTLSHGDASFSSDVWTGLITWSASHSCKEGGQNPRGCHEN